MKNRRFNKTKKKEIIEKYNSTSHFYDNRYKEIQELKYSYITEQINLNHKHILDAGCGTGLFLIYLLDKMDFKEKNNGFLYVGIDISQKMLDKFSLKFEDVNPILSKRINLVLADLENIPFRNNKFDILFSLTSYQNLPNMKKGFKESMRILKNKAEIRISILKKKKNINSIISSLKNKIIVNKIVDNRDIEDIIIEGRINK